MTPAEILDSIRVVRSLRSSCGKSEPARIMEIVVCNEIIRMANELEVKNQEAEIQFCPLPGWDNKTAAAVCKGILNCRPGDGPMVWGIRL
jgi:hypothetical protein